MTRLLGSIFTSSHKSRRSQRQVSEDARLRDRVLAITGRLEINWPVVAQQTGVPYSTLVNWSGGVVLPTKWLPAMERWVEDRG